MNELLFEIVSEEVPASMQLKACDSLARSIAKELGDITNSNIDELHTFVTPNRMGFCIRNLPSVIKAKEEKIRGPRINAPDKALEGFLRKYGITVEDLTQEGDFFFYISKTVDQDIKGSAVSIIEQSLIQFKWPKSMRWGDYNIKWVRPIRSILCLFNGKVLPLKFGHIESSNKTQGHKFMFPDTLTIKSWEDYKAQMRSSFVVLFPDERKQIIIDNANQLAAKEDLVLEDNLALLNENTGLVEYPNVLPGEVSAEYMDLPEELLITTMRNHQKYLTFRTKSSKLAPKFLIIANIIGADNNHSIKQGNERVLKARLEDAKYFYTQDLKIGSKQRIEKLKRLTFHEKLGSVYDKVQNISAVAANIATHVHLDVEAVKLACSLCKNDLISEVVNELPELQGIAGYYYALHEGYDIKIAQAIRDHYKPMGPHDSLPTNMLGAVVAIADKLDTLSQLFSIGIKPTGSKDPYALRRAAIGIIRVIASRQLDINLNRLGVRGDVIEFIQARLKVMKEEGSLLQYVIVEKALNKN